MAWTDKKYQWDPDPVLVRHSMGTLRVFHSGTGGCLTRRPLDKVEVADIPPRGYWPCAQCFPMRTKRLREAL